METKEGPKAKSKVEVREVKETGAEKMACSLCGRPATQLVDGEPSCQSHIEQIYEHQLEDYTRKHLTNSPWREV